MSGPFDFGDERHAAFISIENDLLPLIHGEGLLAVPVPLGDLRERLRVEAEAFLVVQVQLDVGPRRVLVFGFVKRIGNVGLV